MRRLVQGMLLGLLLSAAAYARAPLANRGHGYVFFAPGVVLRHDASALHVGFGGEALVYKGLGVGGELGYAFGPRAVQAGAGVLSGAASYYFLGTPSLRKVGPFVPFVPFVTGGYSLAFRSESAGLIHFGGGVSCWFSGRMGLRFEVRDYFPQAYPSTHFLEFRTGLAFRLA